MKRLLVLFLMLTITMLLTSCSNNGIKFVVRYNNEGGFGMDEETLTFFSSKNITSEEELIMICQQMQNGYFDKQSSSYYSKIGKIIRSYDETFFENNNLIISAIPSGQGYRYKVKELSVDDNKLIIYINKKRKKGFYTDEGFFHLLILEVNKEDVSNVDYVEMKLE